MAKKKKQAIQLFQEKKIRTLWDDEQEKWYFSIVDVVAVLTESKATTAYWRKLKQRLKAEGNETVTNCHALKMQAADGKMRKTVFIMGLSFALTLALAGCSVNKTPPFSSSYWTLAGNVASSAHHNIAINFGGKSVFPMTNMSDGEYDLHFITSDEQFQAYTPFCKDYIVSVISKIPLTVDSLQFVLADKFVVFTPNLFSKLMPDYVRCADEAEYVAEANPRTSTIQPHDEIWRNFIFDGKRHRILVVDRLVKNGKHLGIVYIIQGDDKHVPFSGTFHYDVTAPRNTQPVGEHMRALLDITIDAANSHVPPRSSSRLSK